MTLTSDELLDAARVIPVLTVADPAHGQPLARALKAGGLRVVEMTWRTEAALEVMAEMKAAEPDLIVGMGTIRTPGQIDACLKQGVDFFVSPGLTPALGAALLESGVPALPGIATASEAMQAREVGFKALKFFPAEQSGGIAFLKALSGPLPDIRFCPTGGISAELAEAYLALPNVGCVGGSWVATAGQLEAGDWNGITQNARRAAGA